MSASRSFSPTPDAPAYVPQSNYSASQASRPHLSGKMQKTAIGFDEKIEEPKFKTSLTEFSVSKFGPPPPRAHRSQDVIDRERRLKEEKIREQQIRKDAMERARESLRISAPAQPQLNSPMQPPRQFGIQQPSTQSEAPPRSNSATPPPPYVSSPPSAHQSVDKSSTLGHISPQNASDSPMNSPPVFSPPPSFHHVSSPPPTHPRPNWSQQDQQSHASSGSPSAGLSPDELKKLVAKKKKKTPPARPPKKPSLTAKLSSQNSVQTPKKDSTPGSPSSTANGSHIRELQQRLNNLNLG
ncbi:hypothetical protein HII13_001541 [Brettanomyces bruxellensis]|nr:hypothetical protein HII13_001541 [Brettanomyces bruxellensis]